MLAIKFALQERLFDWTRLIGSMPSLPYPRRMAVSEMDFDNISHSTSEYKHYGFMVCPFFSHHSPTPEAILSVVVIKEMNHCRWAVQGNEGTESWRGGKIRRDKFQTVSGVGC